MLMFGIILLNVTGKSIMANVMAPTQIPLPTDKH